MSSSTSVDEAFARAVRTHQGGDLAGAEAAYRHIIATAPDHSPASNNLGLLLAMTDRVGAAIDCFRQALRADPHSADASANLARALQHTAQHEPALRQWQHTASLAPAQMEPVLSGALLAMQLQKFDLATDLLEQAAQGRTDHDDIRVTLINAAASLGGHRLDAGDLQQAHRIARLLANIDSDGDIAPRLLERCLRNAQLREFDPGIKADLLHCYRCDVIDHRHLGRISAQMLCAQYPSLIRGATQDWVSTFEKQGVHRDPLLLGLLTRSINVDTRLEHALCAVRRELLMRCVQQSRLDAHWLDFLAALALQCFANEYVFSQQPAELQALQALRADVGRAASGAEHEPDWQALAMFAAYQPPLQFDSATASRLTPALEARRAPPWTERLWQVTVLEPREEQRIRAALDAGAINDSTSQDVQSQYEESPYPRWQTLEQQQPITVAELLRESIAGRQPAALFDGPVAILIAGCGTGEHALRVAARHADCQVDAIDLSRASIAYAMRKARELGINNIRFRHQDILTLHSGDEPYALIESVGVIHHMHDPGAGLAALCARLAPQGVIKLGLYARAARAKVNLARQRISELGLRADAQGMRALRARILDGDEPSLRELCESQDFWTLSTVRDLLFHVREHQYDTEQLHALLSANDLQVIGFAVPALARQRYVERFADEPALDNLTHWGAIERDHPGTFAGMYQFWCARR